MFLNLVIKCVILLIVCCEKLKAQVQLNKENLAALCNCSNSATIVLNELNIETIDPNTFNGLTDLIRLDLDSNLLRAIDPATFNGLVSLQVLTLY